MFEKYMIVEENLKNLGNEGEASGFQIGARLPYYRGVSLSMVEEIELSVNGTIIPQQDVEITVHGNSYNLHQRENEIVDRWEMGEVAILKINKKGGLAPGTHDLGLKINIRIGYLPFPAIRQAAKTIHI